MRSLYFFFIFSFFACSLPKTSITMQPSTRDSSYYWDFFEKIYQRKITKKEIQDEFGTPKEVSSEEQSSKKQVWIYDNAIEKIQEWAFGFDEKGDLAFAIYMPMDTKLFTLSEIEKKWKRLKCERQLKETLNPGLIKHTRYLVCDNEKRIVEYNKYEEIFSIRLKK